MKLFIHDHLLLISFYFVQLAIICFLVYSGTDISVALILYGAFLSILILCIYLSVRFYQLKTFYGKLEQQDIQLNDWEIDGVGHWYGLKIR
ncbi:hypothetical protein JCM19046_3639 [Bacillus sp. JCM 19046]|nr:hypothetical protein JCM19045_4854 [Bacillus sp. JCM 19045]GAF19014.1 hypothetical protein JCM19046_3639 [Bacillus sp. JCM 19046]